MIISSNTFNKILLSILLLLSACSNDKPQQIKKETPPANSTQEKQILTDISKSDYIELQQARQGYINSKASLVVDYYNFYSALAVLENAIGK